MCSIHSWVSLSYRLISGALRAQSTGCFLLLLNLLFYDIAKKLVIDSWTDDNCDGIWYCNEFYIGCLWTVKVIELAYNTIYRLYSKCRSSELGRQSWSWSNNVIPNRTLNGWETYHIQWHLIWGHWYPNPNTERKWTTTQSCTTLFPKTSTCILMHSWFQPTSSEWGLDTIWKTILPCVSLTGLEADRCTNFETATQVFLTMDLGLGGNSWLWRVNPGNADIGLDLGCFPLPTINQTHFFLWMT